MHFQWLNPDIQYSIPNFLSSILHLMHAFKIRLPTACAIPEHMKLDFSVQTTYRLYKLETYKWLHQWSWLQVVTITKTERSRFSKQPSSYLGISVKYFRFSKVLNIQHIPLFSKGFFTSLHSAVHIYFQCPHANSSSTYYENSGTSHILYVHSVTSSNLPCTVNRFAKEPSGTLKSAQLTLYPQRPSD